MPVKTHRLLQNPQLKTPTSGHFSAQYWHFTPDSGRSELVFGQASFLSHSVDVIIPEREPAPSPKPWHQENGNPSCDGD